MTMGDKIAWAGELELKEAKWTDKDGHLVKLRLVTPNEDRPNPFKAFTKRRGKRAGTRFIASLSHVQGSQTDAIAYNGEFMLAGWGDTSTDGYTVTFWCEPPESGIHAFQGYTRGRDTFMAALVELDENDMPVSQTKRDRVEAATGSGQAEGGEQAESAPADDAHRADELATKGTGPNPRGARKLSQYVAMLCQNPEFWEWINTETDGGVVNTEQAADWLRKALGIESRRELDENEHKAHGYHEYIRKPFVEWQEKRDAVVA